MHMNFNGPILFSPDASMDAILGFLSAHFGIPKDKFEEAFARAEGTTSYTSATNAGGGGGE